MIKLLNKLLPKKYKIKMNYLQRSDVNFSLFIFNYVNKNSVDFYSFCQQLGYTKEDTNQILCLTYYTSEKDLVRLSEYTGIPFCMIKVSISDLGIGFKARGDELKDEQKYNTIQMVLRNYLCDPELIKEIKTKFPFEKYSQLPKKEQLLSFFDYGCELVEKKK